MQCKKDDIRGAILKGVRKEFLKKGFRNASMRDIAAASCTGTGNIYNYFSGKDEIFRLLAAPAVESIDFMLEEHHGQQGKDILEMNSKAYFCYVVEEYVTMIVRNRTALELLLFHAEGSSLANFREEYADKCTAVFKQYLARMGELHPGLNTEISDFSIRLHSIWMFAILEEILRQKIKPKEINQIITEYMTGEIHGWSELIKI